MSELRFTLDVLEDHEGADRCLESIPERAYYYFLDLLITDTEVREGHLAVVCWRKGKRETRLRIGSRKEHLYRCVAIEFYVSEELFLHVSCLEVESLDHYLHEVR